MTDLEALKKQLAVPGLSLTKADCHALINELAEARRKVEAVVDRMHYDMKAVISGTAEQSAIAHARAAMAEEAACECEDVYSHGMGAKEATDRAAQRIRALAPLPASVRCVRVEVLERVKAAGTQLFKTIEGGWALDGSPIGRAKWADARANLRAALAELEEKP